MNDKIIAHLLAAALMIIWGLSYLSIKIVVIEINPILSAFYRFLIASAVLYVVHKIKCPKENVLKEDKVKMALGGLFGVAIYFFFENYSVLFTSTSNVAILISSIPVFTLISQKVLFKERFTSSKVMGALLSVIGIIIIITAKEKVSLFSKGTVGDLMAIGAAICWVIYNIVSSNFKGNYKSITVTTYQALWGCLFLSPTLFFCKISVPSTKVVLNLLFLSILCSCVGYVIYIFCLERLGPTVITTYINLQPIVSLISAKLILMENVTLWQVLGCAIIILGVYFVSTGDNFNMEKFKETI